MTQIELLGRTLTVTVLPDAQGVADEVLSVIEGAVAVLNDQFAKGQLSPVAIGYVGSLQGLGVALHRSFTPCIGTADVEDGEFVYFFGHDDVVVNADPLW